MDATTLQHYWSHGLEWETYLESLETKRDVWLANTRRARVRPEEQARLTSLPGPRRCLVLTEDWCGDAARSVPVIARALAEAPGVEVRFLPSDEHPEAINRWLTHGGRAIPLVLVEDERGRELGTWGPRPAPLQALLRTQLASQGRPAPDQVSAFYTPIMAWYGKDQGVTIVQELLMLLERGGTPR